MQAGLDGKIFKNILLNGIGKNVLLCYDVSIVMKGGEWFAKRKGQKRNVGKIRYHCM